MTQLPAGKEFMNINAVEKARRNHGHRARAETVTSIVQPFDPDDGLIEATAWHGQPVPARKWIVDGWIPRGEVTMLTGNGGEGKTLLTMQLLVAATAGGSWLGKSVPNVRVLGVYCEDNKEELQRRLDGILSGERLSFADCDGLIPLARKGKDSVMFEAHYNDMEGRTTKFYHRLHHTILEIGAEIIVLDSLHNFFAGNENHRAQANQFINALCELAELTDAAVVLVSHPSRAGKADGSGEAGNTAWHNTVRSRLYLHRKKHESGDPDQLGPLVLDDMKQNYGAKNEPIEVRYDNGRFVDVGPIVSHKTKPVMDRGNLFGERD